MIEYILAVIVLAAVLLFASNIDQKRKRGSRISKDQTMLYKHDSRDIAAEVYYPAIRDSTSLFPLGKKEEREKTETFENKH